MLGRAFLKKEIGCHAEMLAVDTFVVTATRPMANAR